MPIIPEPIKVRQSAPESEVSAKFLQGMVNRMGVSYYKYGAVANNFPGDFDALGSILRYLERYKDSRNTEFLMDVANFCMIEFMHPSVEGAFFEGTDSDQSPGRVTR